MPTISKTANHQDKIIAIENWVIYKFNELYYSFSCGSNPLGDTQSWVWVGMQQKIVLLEKYTYNMCSVIETSMP